jgi:predicted phage terminase large subunit-like protein
MCVQEIRPTTDKVTKIMKMQPKYAIGNFYHNSDDKNTVILEEELTRFPKSVHDDVIDALSGIIEIMLPVQKEVQRTYQKMLQKRKLGTQVSY